MHRTATGILELKIELFPYPQDPWNVFDYIIVATTTSQQLSKWFATETEAMKAIQVPRALQRTEWISNRGFKSDMRRASWIAETCRNIL